MADTAHTLDAVAAVAVAEAAAHAPLVEIEGLWHGDGAGQAG